jgi:hypothetical protein
MLSQNGSRAYPVLHVGLGHSSVVSFLIADPNPADHLTFLILEDPGLPSASASVQPTKCIPRQVFNAESSSFVFSNCSLAVASLSWTVLLEQLPMSAPNGYFSAQLCLIARDSSTRCSGTSSAATPAGWYSSTACAELRVVIPELSWTASSMRSQPPYPVISVGFDCAFLLAANLTNTASVPTDMPLNVSVSGNVTDTIMNNVRVVPVAGLQHQQWQVDVSFSVHAAHQGRSFSACFEAVFEGLPGTRQRVCATVVVRVCSVCTRPNGSLYAVALHYFSTTNWQALMHFNRQCTSERLCISNPALLPVSSDLVTSSQSGNTFVPGLAIGDAVVMPIGGSAASLAHARNTSEALLQRWNPSRAAGAEGEWCVPTNVREDD